MQIILKQATTSEFDMCTNHADKLEMLTLYQF